MHFNDASNCLSDVVGKGRRHVLVTLAGTALAVVVRSAPAAERSVRRVGVLGIGDGGMYNHWKKRFPEEFTARSFSPGRNLQLLWYDVVPTGPHGRLGSADLLAASRKRAAEMAAADLDCMVANGEPHARLLQEASRTIPMVVSVPDPVGFGFAKTLARPGGNITGLHEGVEEVAVKTVEIFRKLVPDLGCVAWIGWENFLPSARPLQAATAAMGLRFLAVVVKSDDDAGLARLREEMARLRREGCRAAQVASYSEEMERAVVESAATHGIAIAGAPARRDGILFGYSAHRAGGHESARRVPAIVARILRGERPGDIPFEGPSHYELSLNLRTAARIGIKVPPEVLVLADSVVRP